MSLGSLVSGFVPQLMLGEFMFMLNTAVFQEMNRTAEYKWPGQERFGQRPALQYTGLGAETITLPGVIYPMYKGSANAMATLRGMAAQGKPLMLLDAQGNLYGRWVIKSVDEKRSVFAMFNMPRKIEFNITIERYDGNDTNLLANLLNDALQSL